MTIEQARRLVTEIPGPRSKRSASAAMRASPSVWESRNRRAWSCRLRRTESSPYREKLWDM